MKATRLDSVKADLAQAREAISELQAELDHKKKDEPECVHAS